MRLMPVLSVCLRQIPPEEQVPAGKTKKTKQTEGPFARVRADSAFRLVGYSFSSSERSAEKSESASDRTFDSAFLIESSL